MAFILNIDTATEYAGVCISNGKDILAIEESNEQKNHAAFVQSAIKKVLADAGLKPASIEAIAITEGPGSYTGLRVGMASAKGLCYVLKIPLILINTLEVMALASNEATESNKIIMDDLLFCPMIDARRQEVFTALYNNDLQKILPPFASVLDDHSFSLELAKRRIMFSGNGSRKLKELISHRNAIFSDVVHHISQLSFLSAKAFTENKFSNLAYSEPFYLKEFFDPSKKSF